MQGYELPCRTAEEVARVVRALGSHRYVGSRLILVHAATFYAVSGLGGESERAELTPAIDWANHTLGDPSIDPASRDERLVRRSTEKELACALGILWGEHRVAARDRLRTWLTRHEIAQPSAEAMPFEETNEEDAFPLLVDAGWELLPLSSLERERHRGAIEAFAEPILFESARFEESEAIPPRVTLHELSAIGPVEALHAVDDDGALQAPLVLWMDGNETYLDYVLRGVLRAAKLHEA